MEIDRSVKSNRSLSFFPTEGYFLQQPLLQLFSSVAFVATVVLSAQQPALQDLASTAQQSHLQTSHKQTPDLQQHPPSGQHVSQEQTFESTVDFEVPATFAPIAAPSPMTHNNINVAANFILNSFTCFLWTTVYAKTFQLLTFLDASRGNELHTGCKLF